MEGHSLHWKPLLFLWLQNPLLPWKTNWIQSCYLVGLTLLIFLGILVSQSQIFIFIQNSSELLFIPSFLFLHSVLKLQITLLCLPYFFLIAPMSIYIFDSGVKSNTCHPLVIVEIHIIPTIPISFLIVNSFQGIIASSKFFLSTIGPVFIIVSHLMPQCATLIMP